MHQLWAWGLVGTLGVLSTACGNDGDDGGGGGGGDTASGGTGGGSTPQSTGGSEPVTEGTTFGETHEGSYHLGPVDFAETEWHNACAPYPPEIQTLTGVYLAGVDNSLAGDGSLCDACALVTTRLGRELLVHLVTFGVSNAPGDMDVSPEAYEFLHEEDPEGTPSNPRPMTWQLAECPAEGNIFLQWQTEANIWWTSLWVRNSRLPVSSLEVRSTNHSDYAELQRGTDGTFTDASGFGEGAFDLRITASDGTALTASFDSFEPGSLVNAGVQFD
jgi:hypothetical protein